MNTAISPAISRKSSSSRKLAAPLGMAALLLFAGPAARAQILYQTGFEAPNYTAGQVIDGQDFWNGFNSPGAGIVSTAAPATGSQALQVSGSALDFLSFAGVYVGSYQPPVVLNPVAAPTLLIQTDARLDGPVSDGDFSSANLYVYGSGETLAEIYISSDGHIYSDNGLSFGNFAQSYTPGQYATLGVELDFAAMTDTFFVNGDEIGSLALPAGADSDGVFFNVDSLGSPDAGSYSHNNYTASFDNLSAIGLPASAVPVPEASSFTLLGLGLLTLTGLCARGRRTRVVEP